ncbi:MAG: hypothetical protein COA49_06045 [Bacteroidetes bacterium]|nr:MAG: hypothetical protein COA49_06045 [Bacteroidota bacterium]
MLNDVVEQSFAHVLAYPVDDESAHRLIRKANKSLKTIALQAKRDNLIEDEDLKQAALQDCVKQAQRVSLELLSELQVLRRNQSVMNK